MREGANRRGIARPPNVDAPGTEATYAAIRDPARRPAQPRSAIPEEVLSHVPAEPVTLAPNEVAAAAKRVGEARRVGTAGRAFETAAARHPGAGALGLRCNPLGASAACQAGWRSTGDSDGRRLSPPCRPKTGQRLGSQVRPSYTTLPIRTSIAGGDRCCGRHGPGRSGRAT